MADEQYDPSGWEDYAGSGTQFGKKVESMPGYTPPQGYTKPTSPTSVWGKYNTREGFRDAWQASGVNSLESGQKWLADSGAQMTSLNGREKYRLGDNENYDLLENLNNPSAGIRAGWNGYGGQAESKGGVSGSASAWIGAPGVMDSAAGPAVASPSLVNTGQQDSEREALVADLIRRSQQSLTIDPRTDPNIRGAADAYSANEERSKRNYLADLAEEAGPLANIRGESRMASERVGQRTGAYEADLVLREQTARRAEIAQALTERRATLTTQQELALRKELALIDDAMNRMKLQQDSSQFNADMGYKNAALAQSGSQFSQNLGLSYDDLDWRRSPLNPSNFPS